MGINQYPAPTQGISIDGSNTVKVANNTNVIGSSNPLNTLVQNAGGAIASGNPLHATITNTPSVTVSGTPTVAIDGTTNTVKVANTNGAINAGNPLYVSLTNSYVTTKLDSSGNLYKSYKGYSNNITGQAILTTTTSYLIIHSITISQNCTSNNPSDGDRLGIVVFANTTSTLDSTKIIASNYTNVDGTTVHQFPNGGLKMTAGDDLWVCADQYNVANIGYNFTVSVQYTEVMP